jgi:hypothetical protein
VFKRAPAFLCIVSKCSHCQRGSNYHCIYAHKHVFKSKDLYGLLDVARKSTWNNRLHRNYSNNSYNLIIHSIKYKVITCGFCKLSGTIATLTFWAFGLDTLLIQISPISDLNYLLPFFPLFLLLNRLQNNIVESSFGLMSRKANRPIRYQVYGISYFLRKYVG